MSATLAHASPLLRVRGSSHFANLRATPHTDERIEVQGTLLDDLDQPISNAVVTLPPALAPRGCDDNPVIATDHQGKFCAHVDNRGTATRVVFPGDNLLSDTHAVVETRASQKPPLSVVLDAPVEWSRDAAQHVVTLTLNSEEAVFASVSLHRDQTLLTTLPRVSFSGLRAVVEVATTLLPAAGPVTLRAEVVTARGEVVTSAQLGIDVVSTIHLSADESHTGQTRTGDEMALHFQLTGDPPVVDSGWVDLQVDGASVAIAPVHNGRSELSLALTAARQRDVQLRAVFVPQSPFHRASEPLTWTVTVLGPRRWFHIPLAALLLGFTWRLLRMWRRPTRESARATLEHVSGVPSVVVREPGEPLDGWQGIVRDAHTGAPIAGATVALLVPSLVPAPPAREAVTSSVGTFRFDKLTPLPEGSRLVVHAEHHSSLEYAAPQPGALEITLVARRRTLLAAVREWAKASPRGSQPDPTPLELARQARVDGDERAAEWILRIDEAVYGRDPVLGETETALLGHRPARVQSGPKGR